MKWVVAIGVAAGAALVYLLSQASANTALFTQHYAWLFGLSAVVSLALMALIGYQIAGLIRKLRASVFGALLTVRLTAVFVLMALIPGALLYALSVQFLDRTIESWFEIKVDKALEAGLALGRSVLDQNARELTAKVEAAAPEAVQAVESGQLAQLRERLQAEFLQVRRTDGTLLLGAGSDAAPQTEAAVLQAVVQARDLGTYRTAEQLADGVLLLRVATRTLLAGESRVVVVEQRLRGSTGDDVRRVEEGYRDYQELLLFRTGLKRLFAATLTLALLLTLFSAIALALFLSERISAPLSALAEATRAVAAGDYSRLNPVTSHDEFGVLTQSFNTMTRRIGDATTALEQQRGELERANRYLESILSNLSSGVLTFDADLRLRTGNAAAWRALACEEVQVASRPFAEWGQAVPHLAQFVEAAIDAFGKRVQSGWARQLSVTTGATVRTLFVRGTPLATADSGQPTPSTTSGFVLVFDDISQLKEVERAAAWGEVARRLAHEIKNPLTPIQLSAERLQMKLEGKVGEAEREILRRATGTIVSQVTALKSMVDDFGQYARAGSIKVAAVDLNQLVRDVLHLYESSELTLRVRLDPAITTIEADAALLRQVLHNLLQNAMDALAGTPEPAIAVTTARHGDRVVIAFEDNGCGISPTVLPRIFEPYITTKAKGTGLGLAIVRRIVEEHGGDVQIENVVPRGARATLGLPIASPAPIQPRGSVTGAYGTVRNVVDLTKLLQEGSP